MPSGSGLIEVHNRVSDFNTYRAARVKSLFNAESGCNFDLAIDADLSGDWSIGAVIGPSGSGKTSIGKTLFGGGRIVDISDGWDDDLPIIDCISPDGDFNEVCDVLSAVGLGSVPSWLRPFGVLSNGERFRAGLARLIMDGEGDVVIDEFTSVVDRQIARIGSAAFQRKWRKRCKGRKAVVLSPHYDIIDWLEPDWVIDTKDGTFSKERHRRPEIDLKIRQTNSSYWRYFKPHYYLDLPLPVAAQYFVGTVDGELVCHMAVCPRFNNGAYRGTRLVTMPEWQGIGIATAFLDWVAQYHLDGNGRKGMKYPMDFHTSHPGLCAYFRSSGRWTQISAATNGANKGKSRGSIKRAQRNQGRRATFGTGYGGHFRAIQGFRYLGDRR